MPFNFFKRSKPEKPQLKDEAPVVKVQETAKLESKAKEEVASAASRRSGGKAKKASPLSGVLLNPHITEKATMLGEKGQYVFRVHPQATKDAVKQSVEVLYGVTVRNVRLIKKPAKKIRIGKKEGVKQGLKKAMVQLKIGESIEVISR